MAQSHACCTVPPVISKGYDAKGTYTTIDGMKTYVTGPSDAKKALLVIYDIFGFKDQTIQGADILATSDKENQYKVFMPDFFEGKPVDISDYPPDTKEKGERLGKFFETTGAPPKTVGRIPKVIDEIKSQNQSIQSWGIVGFCWGGKIVNLSSQKDTVFKAAAACHPAMVDPNDATGISIPIAMLPSKDEDKEAVEKWEQGVKTKHLVKWYNDQVHGFMAARADLEDENVKKNYMDAYGVLLNFFHEHL
ncbi:alpha/beta-hydrolase [Aureobasidium pullulans]|uniref:Alpha/beta-hydrolase n=1 Tax=Aureobasidium pullulans TaxID=5580 RepID=A0A4S8XME9_AURPU|nr:alpha/beta-hydrolase [Aureobasidium pullulans]THW39045.1 alpha/beta-hydrolase [Aureobasidium pullulans]THW61651.1 alpha/beta-hydrolase [Aureobasidium pullulans]THY13427.1 alpha/beta-hydrolase [Aureobasidium pullulans]THY39102.1 alpha/beta-hydrolase [Aureobasidium pullulans]